MNDKFVLRLVSSLVVASFAAISAAGAPSVPYRVQYPLPTLGMFDGMSVHTKPYNLTASDYPAIKAAGFSWVRAQMSWFAIEHVQGQYDFSTMDTFVQNAKASGLRVHFYLDGGNAFYTGNNGTYPTTTTQIAAFDNFAKAAVGHYQHQGIMWEMLNEPDLEQLLAT